jgi:hypothetical protein
MLHNNNDDDDDNACLCDFVATHCCRIVVWHCVFSRRGVLSASCRQYCTNICTGIDLRLAKIITPLFKQETRDILPTADEIQTLDVVCVDGGDCRTVDRAAESIVLESFCPCKLELGSNSDP